MSLPLYYKYLKRNALGISRRQGKDGLDFDELSRIAARSTNIEEIKIKNGGPCSVMAAIVNDKE